jgi:hypothetical protein
MITTYDKEKKKEDKSHLIYPLNNFPILWLFFLRFPRHWAMVFIMLLSFGNKYIHYNSLASHLIQTSCYFKWTIELFFYDFIFVFFHRHWVVIFNDAPPNFLKNSNANLKVKITKEKIVGVHSLTRNTLGWEGCVGVLRWGLGWMTSESTIHIDLHKPISGLKVTIWFTTLLVAITCVISTQMGHASPF